MSTQNMVPPLSLQKERSASRRVVAERQVHSSLLVVVAYTSRLKIPSCRPEAAESLACGGRRKRFTAARCARPRLSPLRAGAARMTAKPQGRGGDVPSAQEEASRAGNRFRSAVFNCCGGPRLSILIADARSRDFDGAPRSWNGENPSFDNQMPELQQHRLALRRPWRASLPEMPRLRTDQVLASSETPVGAGTVYPPCRPAFGRRHPHRHGDHLTSRPPIGAH